MPSTPAVKERIWAAAVPRTMRALVKEQAGPKMALREVAVPEVGRGDVLIRVKKAGICGTDAHIWNWDSWAAGRVRPPLIIGHEFMGVVAAVGGDVRSVAVGDRVSAEGHIACGRCMPCRTGQAHVCAHVKVIGVDRDGCFADYIAMPESNVWELDESTPDEWAAVFDPLGNAVHSVMAAGVATKRVLITGAGSIGLMAIPVALAVGASLVIATDPHPHKLAIAKRLGAHHALDSGAPDLRERILSLTGGDGPDVLLEMSGSQTAIDLGLEVLGHAGRAALLGIPAANVSIDLAEDVVLKGLTLLGIFGRKMYETWFQMQTLVTTGRIDLGPIISHVIPLDRFEECFTTLKQGDAVKIVLDVAA